MGHSSKPIQFAVWGMMALTIVAIVLAYVLKEKNRPRKNVDGIELKNVGGTSHGKLPELFPVPEFTLTNQQAEAFGRTNLLGRVWIADIIFTRCAGPCPEMTRRMAELQAAFPPQLPVSFVTLTADPDFDTPRVLQAYARRFGAQTGRWHFLTGTKKQIVDLAVDGLKLTAVEKEAGKQIDPNDLFIHSTIFVVVDKRGRARAVLESDDPTLKVKALDVVRQLIDEN